MINCGEKKSNNTHNAAVMLVRVEVGLSSRKILRRCFCPRIVHIFFSAYRNVLIKTSETPVPRGIYELRRITLTDAIRYVNIDEIHAVYSNVGVDIGTRYRVAVMS